MKKLLIILALSAPAWGAIAVEQNCSSGKTSDYAAACSFSTLPTVGRAVIVGCYSNANEPSVSDNQSNSYTQDVNSANKFKVYSTVIATSSGTFTVSCTSTYATQMAVLAIEVSGLASSNIFDVGAADDGYIPDTANSYVTTAATAQAEEIAVGFLVLESLDDLGYQAPGTGFTGITEFDFGEGGMGGEYKLLSATGTQEIGWNSIPNYWGLYMVGATYKAAASASVTPPRRITIMP